MTGQLRVRIDQELCTGDGICAQLAPQIFELDVDGLAYVKGSDGVLRLDPDASVEVPDDLAVAVTKSARECPGCCIFVDETDAG